MKDYQAILFDLDGTLLNTSIGVMESMEYTIDKLGYEKLPPEAVNDLWDLQFRIPLFVNIR